MYHLMHEGDNSLFDRPFSYVVTADVDFVAGLAVLSPILLRLDPAEGVLFLPSLTVMITFSSLPS